MLLQPLLLVIESVVSGGALTQCEQSAEKSTSAHADTHTVEGGGNG